MEYYRPFSSDYVCTYLSHVWESQLFVDLMFDPLGCEEDIRDFFAYSELFTDFLPLFSLAENKELTKISPILFRIPKADNAFLNWVLEQKAGWGFICISAAEFNVVCKHWQSLLDVLSPEGTVEHFRFYDGSLVAKLLPACTKGEQSFFLGPCAEMLMPLYPEADSNIKEQKNNEARVHSAWRHFTNPRMFRIPAQGVAKEYELRPAPWWQVRDEHSAPFAKELAEAFRLELCESIWEEETAVAQKAYKDYGSVENFVDKLMLDAKGLNVIYESDIEDFVMICAKYYKNVNANILLQSFMCKTNIPPMTRLRDFCMAMKERETRRG